MNVFSLILFGSCYITMYIVILYCKMAPDCQFGCCFQKRHDFRVHDFGVSLAFAHSTCIYWLQTPTIRAGVELNPRKDYTISDVIWALPGLFGIVWKLFENAIWLTYWDLFCKGLKRGLFGMCTFAHKRRKMQRLFVPCSTIYVEGYSWEVF